MRIAAVHQTMLFYLLFSERAMTICVFSQYPEELGLTLFWTC